MKKLFMILGVLFIFIFFYVGVLIWTNSVKKCKVEEMTSQLVEAWTVNDYVLAIELGDQMCSPSFQKKEIHRAACGILDKKTAGSSFKTLGFSRVLYFVTEWSDIKNSAYVHVNFELREMSLYYILSLIKNGQIKKANEVFSWYQENPSFHNETWKDLDRPLITENIANYLKNSDKKESMAKIDMVSLVIGNKYGDALNDFGVSPWGTPYQIFINKNDPVNSSKNPDDFFSDNPLLNYTYFLFTECGEGNYFTYSSEDHQFYKKHPKDFFTFLNRLRTFEESFFFQTQGSAISAFLYFMDHQDQLKKNPKFMPFFINKKGEMSILWDSFLKFTNDFRNTGDDWTNRIDFTFSDYDEVPSNRGSELSLLRFLKADSTVDYVLPFTYGDIDMDGPDKNPKAFFFPPPEECNNPDVVQKIINHSHNSDGNDLALKLSKYLIRKKRFHQPLQITYGNSEIYKNMILIFPRSPLKYPSWILFKRRNGGEPITNKEIKAFTKNMFIPDNKIKVEGNTAVISDTQKNIYFFTLHEKDKVLFYWTDEPSKTTPEMAQEIIDLAI